MGAPKGNQYWKLAHNWKKPKKFTPDELWDKANEYAKWCEDNPLWESKAFGTGLIIKLPKMRAMTIQGFSLFANFFMQTWYEYEKDQTYIDIMTRIRNIFYSQKLEGAAAELLNPAIIARELRLPDRQEIDLISEQPLFPDVSKNTRNK